MVFIRTIANYISMKSYWPENYDTVYLNAVCIFVTWYQALLIAHAVADLDLLEKRFLHIVSHEHVFLLFFSSKLIAYWDEWRIVSTSCKHLLSFRPKAWLVYEPAGIEFFYYPLSAFSFLVKVKNGRYCRKMDYRSPMMLVVWASYPDHQVHLLIWVLGHDINIPLKELRGVFFKS